ncbi:hypothetical protein BJ912DRAFT_363709 [Pholiota molesta]|nr:hypothetical protein BJ912DRAFT_363709 [Pholiota molesta]
MHLATKTTTIGGRTRQGADGMNARIRGHGAARIIGDDETGLQALWAAVSNITAAETSSRFAHLHLAMRTTTGGRKRQGADGWDECDWIRHRGLLTQSPKRTAYNRRRGNRLAGAVSGGQQYHGCRDEQQATHHAFRMSRSAKGLSAARGLW